MPAHSAGILLYRLRNASVEVLLVHPGGPFFAKKDEGSWSIPKGLVEAEEDQLAAARREFREELGVDVPVEDFIALPDVKQKGGKIVHAWAAEGALDAGAIISNTFRMEYPYKSGLWIEAPEIDRAEWFGLDIARQKILPAQEPLLSALEAILANKQ